MFKRKIKETKMGRCKVEDAAYREQEYGKRAPSVYIFCELK
jgi:hypothetical protein